MSNKESIMKKIVLSVIIFILVLSSVSFANCIGDISKVSNAKCVTDYSNNTSVSVMDSVTFGSYPQSDASGNTKEPIEWIVLDKQGDKALLLSKYIINQLPYDQKCIHNGWKSSFLNKFLNEEFIYDAFNENEQNLIIYTNVKNTAYDVYSNKLYSYNFNSKIFLLSYSECKKYFGANSEDKLPYKVLSSKTNYAISNYGAYNGVTSSKKHYPEDAMNFWLRDSHAENEGGQNFTCFVEYNNDYDSIWITSDAANIPIGVRPAIWVDLSISDNVSAYEENNDYADDNSNIDDDTYEDYVEDEIPEDYSNAGNMTKSDTVTMVIKGIEVTSFKRADLKQGWVNDVEGRKFYFFSYDPLEESANLANEGWKEIDGKYYYFTAYGYILTNTTTPDGYRVGADGTIIEKVQETKTQNNTGKDSNTIAGLPSVQSEYRNDGHFYLNNNIQKSTWVYYVTYYYHVDGAGNIEKSKWIEQRYVGADGRMYRGRQTPDGKWVGDDGLVVNVSQDLSHSLTIEAAEPDSWYKTQSGLWYYFENDRTTTKKGWFTDARDNQTYYLDPNTGIMAVGWTTINGSQYYFNESHDNVNNWYETGGGFYESYGKKTKAYGSMFRNEKTPDGHQVDGNGKMIK